MTTDALATELPRYVFSARIRTVTIWHEDGTPTSGTTAGPRTMRPTKAPRRQRTEHPRSAGVPPHPRTQPPATPAAPSEDTRAGANRSQRTGGVVAAVRTA